MVKPAVVATGVPPSGVVNQRNVAPGIRLMEEEKVTVPPEVTAGAAGLIVTGINAEAS